MKLSAGRVGVACVLMAASPGAVSQGVAVGQAYPLRPIRFIVPFPPGGSTDTYARIIGVKLSEAPGRQLVLDDRAGADVARWEKMIQRTGIAVD